MYNFSIIPLNRFSMAVTITPISNTSKKDLKKFILFNYNLYKGNKYAVPELYDDLMNTFMPSKNAAYDFCESQFFLAYKDDKLVGRVAAIINHKANDTWKKKTVRFGWIDFVDDIEVSKGLLDAVEKWGKEKGMEEVEGPLGFTDFDREGMLIMGFDQLGTMASYYNYPYYPEHMSKLGFEKAADWVEFKVFPGNGIPEKFQRICDLTKQRYNLRILTYSSKKKLKEERGKEIFDLMNEAYAPLFGYSALSEKQIDQYIKSYLGFLDLRLVPLVVNEKNELIGVGIVMPSLSKALQRAKGARNIFGYIPLAWSLYVKHAKNIDMLLIAVKPEYQGRGVNALIMSHLLPVYHKLGYEFAESNPELEVNNKVQSQWDYFPHENHKRRRAFVKPIE